VAARRAANHWLQKRSKLDPVTAAGFCISCRSWPRAPAFLPCDRQQHRCLLQSHTFPNPLAWIRGRVGRAFITAVGRPAPGGAYAGNRPFTRRVGVNRTAVVSSEISLLSASVDSRAWESWNYRRGEPGFRSPYTLANPARALVLRPNRSCGYEGGKSSNNEAIRHLSPRFELKTISQFGCSGRSSG
jgi:hypothetical protein